MKHQLLHNKLANFHIEHNKKVSEFHANHAAKIANGENGHTLLARWERFLYNNWVKFFKSKSEN